MHAYITRCYINYSALHTLQTFRLHTHTHSTPHYSGTYHTYTTHQTYFAYQVYIA